MNAAAMGSRLVVTAVRAGKIAAVVTSTTAPNEAADALVAVVRTPSGYLDDVAVAVVSSKL